LVAKGLELSRQPPEVWNLEQPDEVRDIHDAFYRAGAMAVHTNTFGANRMRLRAYGLENLVKAANQRGALLALEARPPGGLVIGSLGPTGSLPPPEGDADLIELEDTFAEQAMYLAEGGVDFLHVETLYHPKEARAALRGCRFGAPELPVVASISCRQGNGGYLTHIGFSAEQIIQVLAEERADGVGVNCSMAPADMLDLVAAVADIVNAPIFAQPTIAPDGQAPLYPAEFASGVTSLFAAGARAVGGCCGTSAQDVQLAYAAMTARHRLPTQEPV
jgi:methionine synthase I (cobalamin-dependent)